MKRTLIIILAAFSFAGPALAGIADDELNIFGYMQVMWYTEHEKNGRNDNSFNVQQLNLMMQREVGERWGAFVNIESVNSFNTSKGWGSIGLEEAWVRFRQGPKFNLKLGLLIPTFNRFNEIKNRMPLHPYIIRPIVYEAAFVNEVALDEYVPRRAFVQAYGYLPGRAKIDYAVYLGNSPAINSDPSLGVTGVDTSSTILMGGRVGLRLRNFQAGVSGTYEHVNYFEVLKDTLGGDPQRYENVPRTRFGADLSFETYGFTFEGELIKLVYHEDIKEVDLDKHFWYVTLGYNFTERWFGYLSYWEGVERFTDLVTSYEAQIRIPNLGVNYRLNDRITFKGAYAPILHSNNYEPYDASQDNFQFITFAASVFF